MNRNLIFSALSTCVLAAASLLAGCASAPSIPPVGDSVLGTSTTSSTRTWRYRVFDVLSGEEFPAGTAQLSGRPGDYSFRLTVVYPAPCAQGTVAASVTTDETYTFITAQPRMRGCGVRRYVIRNDGTGGRVETKNGDSWVPDPYDRGLTRM